MLALNCTFIFFVEMEKTKYLRSRTTIVWPFFVYSKMAMFQAKNRAFRVIQHYDHHIYSESSHQKQSFKKIKMICHASISKINFI